jgi:hypothetical protein
MSTFAVTDEHAALRGRDVIAERVAARLLNPGVDTEPACRDVRGSAASRSFG